MTIDLRAEGVALGEALAAEGRFLLEGLGLDRFVSAQFVPERHAVRFEWADASPDDTLDFPASEPWVEKVCAALPKYALASRR